MQLLVTTNGTSATIYAGLNGQNSGSYVVYGTIKIDRPYLSITCDSTYANDLLISAVVSGVGGLRTNGSNTKKVRISAANSYEGGTVVASGRLLVYSSGTLGTGPVTVSAGTTLDLDTATAVSDAAAVTLATGTGTYGRIDLASGITETVGTLTINDKLQYSGTYGATGSGAMFIDDNYFVGTGKLLVLGGKSRPTLIAIQ